jgi:6-pyruvoyltetrahydropterin/6-carboxytetrahydropterin synthase
VSGEVDAKLGWIVDFAEIDRAFAPLLAQLDHNYLNEVPGLENPTSELLARWVIERVRLPAGRVHAVSIAETCSARCTVYADDAG